MRGSLRELLGPQCLRQLLISWAKRGQKVVIAILYIQPSVGSACVHRAAYRLEGHMRHCL